MAHGRLREDRIVTKSATALAPSRGRDGERDAMNTKMILVKEHEIVRGWGYNK